MGCTPSFPLSSVGAFCRGYNSDRSPPCSSNHLLLSGGSTSQSTPSRPEKEKCELLNQELDVYQVDLKLGPMRISRGQLKALTVFPKEDSVSDAWASSLSKRGHDVSSVRSVDDVVREQSFDLLVVDARSPKLLRAEMVAECVRNCEGGALCTIVAIVKKSCVERDSQRIQFLLNYGFNRIVVESTSKCVVLNELLQIERTDLVLQQQTRALGALFTALDSCKDIVHITDSQHHIQYINRSSENFLGFSLDELWGKTIWEVHGSDHHRVEVRTPTGSDVRSTDSLSHPPSIHRPSIDNRSAEFVKDVKHYNLDVSEAVNLQMRRGKDWEGLVTCRRKSGDVINLSSKVVPVPLHSRQNDFFVYTSDASSQPSDRLELFHHHPRGSIKSLRKGSYDIRSLNSDEGSLESELHGGVLSAPIQRDKFTFNRPSMRFDSFRREGSIIRRQSVAKLHSVMMEAPITRVMNLITAAQESSPAYIAQALDKVLEILRSTELYNPQMIHDANNTKPVPADPVATDLLGALLSHAPKPLSSGRRSSSSDQSVKVSSNPRPSLPNFQQASGAIIEVLAEDLNWTFDVIKLEKISEKRPLVWLGMSIMCQFNVPSSLGCDEQTLQNWLTLIEANYLAGNTYHNSTHAADVLQTTAFFLQKQRLKGLFDPLDAAACLIAAVVHDVDHPGKNSQFLCNTNNELAILYNDVCVLESHHSAVSFKLTFSDDRVNILKGLDIESYKFVRKNVVDMVLATDMAKHFEHVNKFINMLEKCISEEEATVTDAENGSTLDFAKVNTTENLQIIKRMMIKCADISNPLRPLHLCKDWAIRIANEYFNQTEEEKRRRIPVVMPQFDRTTCSIPKSQIGFIDFFIFDMIDAWHELAQVPELMEHLKDNYQYWKEQEEAEGRLDRSRSPLVESPTSHKGSVVEEIIVEEIS